MEDAENNPILEAWFKDRNRWNYWEIRRPRVTEHPNEKGIRWVTNQTNIVGY